MEFKKWVRLDYGMTYLANETILVAVTAEASGNGGGTCQVEISTSLEKPESVFPAYKISIHAHHNSTCQHQLHRQSHFHAVSTFLLQGMIDTGIYFSIVLSKFRCTITFLLHRKLHFVLHASYNNS